MLLSKEAEYAQVARDLQDLAEYQTLRLEQVKQLIGIRTGSFESEEIVQCRKTAVLNFWP